MTSESTLLAQTPRETSLSSAEIRRSWDERIKEHSVFSARTTSGKYLDMVKKRLAEVASRQVTPQRAEEMLRRTLQDLGYRPETGFPDARTGAVPPATPGDIRDLSSSRRIQLILDTNVKQARSLGQIAASEDPMQLMMHPAWKLTRTGARKKPRGDWKKRWAEAGARCGWKGAAKKQMVALKTSPIWQAIADGSGGFRDTLGSPYPPFAFGSGLGWVNVGRSEWKRICASEGIPDGLEDVTAKAKELKAAKKAAGASVSAPSAGVVSTPLPSTVRPAGRGSGLLGNPAAGTSRTVRTPPPSTPQTEPVVSFRANFRSRIAADDVIDAAIDEMRGLRNAAERSMAEISDAESECRRIAGNDPQGEEAAALESFAERMDMASDAKSEIDALWGRIINYGSAVGSTPVPRSAKEQSAFDETMARYRTAAEGTLRLARAQSSRVGMAAEAAKKTVERMDRTVSASPADTWKAMWCKNLLERATRTMESVVGSHESDVAAEIAKAKERAKAELPEGSETAMRLDAARNAYEGAKRNLDMVFAELEKRCSAGDADGAGVAMARFGNAAEYCRGKVYEIRSALEAYKNELSRVVKAGTE